MSEHVPGPWNCTRAYVIALDGDEKVRIPLIVPEDGENEIARVSLDYTEEATKANARLIAAAPDLLKAVKEMYPLLVDEDKVLAEYDIAYQWRAAIRKAEGR